MNSILYSAVLATQSSLAAYERDGQLKSWCWPRKDAFHNHLRFLIMGLVQRDETIWLDPERDQISFHWISPLESLQIHWHIHHPAARGLHVRLEARFIDERTLEHIYFLDASEQSSLHDTRIWILVAPDIAGRRSQFQCVRTSPQTNVIRCDADPYILTISASGDIPFKQTGALQIDSQTSLGHLVQSFIAHPGAFRAIEMGRCAAIAISPVIRWNSPFKVHLELQSLDENHTGAPLAAMNADGTMAHLPTPAIGIESENSSAHGAMLLSSSHKPAPSLSLQVLDALTTPNGAILASAECDWDMRYSGGYGFVWPRDAAFVGLSLYECGYIDRAARIALFLSKALGRAHDFEQRYTDAAQPAPSWCLRQPDQRPLACLLWIALLSERTLSEKTRAELRAQLNVCLAAMADELLSAPSRALFGFDLWEEREGQHFFAFVCAYGALTRGMDLALTDAAQEKYARAAQVAEQLAESHFSPLYPWPARTRLANGQLDFTADASLLACLMPVPEFPMNETQRVTLFNSLRETLKYGVGYRRYVDDPYRGGGCWPLVGLWFALSAQEVLPRLEARKYLKSAIREASAASTPLGYLPEQIDPQSSHPTWVVPLAWSHAFFLQLTHRARKIEEVQKFLDEPQKTD